MLDYGLIIISGGNAGFSVATTLVQSVLNVLIVERRNILFRTG